MSLISTLPPHAKTVHRSVSAAGTIFTVPAGQTFYLTGAAMTVIQSGTPAAGNVSIDLTSEDSGTTQSVLLIASAANANQVTQMSLGGFNVRLSGGGTVVLTNGASGSTVSASISGWLDRGA